MNREQLEDRLAKLEEEIRWLEKIHKTKREPVEGTLGGVLQQYRETRNLGVKELALRSNVSPGIITRVEKESFPTMTLKSLLAIARGLGVPASEIIATWEAVEK